jgi:hypothetical protein
MEALSRITGEEEPKEYPEEAAKRGFTRGAKSLVEIWNPDGSEKCIAAFESPSRGAGLRIDAEGNLYLVHCFTAADQQGFASLKPGERTYCRPASLYKLPSRGGKWPLARAVPEGEANNAPGQPLRYRNLVVVGPAWAAQDAASAGFDEQSCGCGHLRWDLDGFARCWMPANHVRSINVWDSNGNFVLRVGRYGNADCRGRGSLVPEPDVGLCWPTSLAVSDEALYVVDVGNRHTLRAKLGYETTAVVAIPR